MDSISAEVQNIQFPVLTHLTAAELQELLDNEEKAASFLEEHINKKKQTKEMIIVENRSLADFNLSRETRLLEGRDRLRRLYEDNKRQRDIYNTNKRTFDERQGNWSIPAAKVMLETSAVKTEEESEDVANNYLDGALSIEEFLEQFQILRRQAHVQKIQSDKMKELVKRLGDYENIEVAPNRTSPYPLPRPAPLPPRQSSNPVSPQSYPMPNTGNIAPMPVPRPVPAPRSSPMYQPGYPQAAPAVPYRY